MSSKIFIIANIGSSSKKYSFYNEENSKTSLIKRLEIDLEEKSKSDNLIKEIKQIIYSQKNKEKVIFALRVVAPGFFFQKDQIINQKFIEKLKKAKEIAPLHITSVLEEIKLIRKNFPKAKIVACSDSKFHETMPIYAKTYAIPKNLATKNQIFRYGYHGLAVQSTINHLKIKKALKPKTIVCHLGSGCSVTAVLKGKSVDNSMGFSPLEGIMGSTRSGTIDPTLKISSNILNHESGFKGLTGSSDLRKILEKIKTKNNSKEQEALDIFIYQIQKAIGSAIATLNGVDLIIFTGGIGYSSAIVRKLILKNLTFTKFQIKAIKIDEEFEMLKICRKLI